MSKRFNFINKNKAGQESKHLRVSSKFMQEPSNYFQSFLIHSVDAFLECDRHHRYLCVNPAAAAWLELEPTDIIGQTNQDLLTIYRDRAALKHLISQIEPCLQQVFLTSEKKIAIHEGFASDGTIKIHEIAYTPVVDTAGTTVRVFAVGRDITSRYGWQEEKQQLLKTDYLDWLNTINSPLGMIAWDREFRIIQWSKRAEEIFGWNDRDVIGKTWRDFRFIYEQDGEGFESQFSQLIDSDRHTSINRNYTKSGHIVWCQWFNSFLRSDDRLTIISWVEDITDRKQLEATLASDMISLGIERKQAEAELKSAKMFLDSIVENLPVGVFAKDADSLRFVLWNKAGEAIAGFTSEEIVGKSDYDFFPKEQADAIAAQDREVLASFQSHYPLNDIIEEPIQTRHKGLRILHTRKIPILDAQGNPEYLLGITEDITERKQVDDSVRLYGQIVENMQIGLYVYHLEDINDDRSLRAIASNPATTEFTGVEMADVLGMTLDEVFPERRAKGIPNIFAAVVREQKAAELEDIDYDRNGAIARAFSIKAFPLPNNCVGVAFENITERKQLELELHQALQQSEHSKHLLMTVIDATPDLIFAKDCNLSYILFNRSNAEAMGKRVEEVLGKNDVELGFSHDEIFGNPDRNIRGLRTDDLRVLAGEIIHNLYDIVTFADGSLHVFDTKKIPLRDAEGHIFAVLGFAHDISDRYLAQEALRQKTSELEAVFQALPDLYFRLNTDGTIVDCLSGSSSDFYIPLVLVVGQKMTEVLPPAVSHKFEQAIQQNSTVKDYKNSDLVTIEYSLPLPQGDRDYEARLLFSKDHQIIMIVRNITERKQAESQLKDKNYQLEQTLQQLRKTQTQLIQAEKMSSLGQLVAGIAHEINNPVSFIYGNVIYANTYVENFLQLSDLYEKYYPHPVSEISNFIQEIELEFLKDDFPKLVESIKIGAERIREIVQSLRNFSRLEEADRKTVDIHQGINSTLLILQHKLKHTKKHCPIQIVKNYGQLPLVECYPSLLNQVFINILNNAIDALTEVRKDPPDQGRELECKDESYLTFSVSGDRLPSIEIRTKVLNSNHIAIIIADNGPGMKESVKTRVFDPFFTTKPVGKGTGLGLSISYQIVVEKHGGALRCISESGAGTEFVIEIPMRQS